MPTKTVETMHTAILSYDFLDNHFPSSPIWYPAIHARTYRATITKQAKVVMASSSVAYTVLSIASPSDADASDERDGK
jgi:hypothetical protein